MRTPRAHKNWLWVSAVVIGIFGPIFTLGTVLATAAPAELTLDLLSWPIDGAQNFAASTTRFLAALTGGFLFGWGVMVACLRAWVYDLAPEGTRRALVVSAAAWFLLDSTGSILSGNPSNAVFNIFVLLLVVGPLWVPARERVERVPA